MSDPIVITRELVKRGWSDFEPKLITGLLTGSAAAFIASVLSTYGIHLDALQQNFIAVACFFLGGYLTPSTGTAVTKRIDAGIREVETHSGPTVTTVTGPTPVQASVPTPIQQSTPGVFTKVMPGSTVADPSVQGPSVPVPTDPNAPTQVLAPPYSRGASILDQLGQNRGQ